MKTIVAIDPAKKTGWAVIDVNEETNEMRVRSSGVATWDAKKCDDLLGELMVPDMDFLVVEDSFERSSGEINRRQFGLAQQRIGYICGFARRMHGGDGRLPIWQPQPSTWRKVMNGMGFEIAHRPRAQAKKDALRVARAFGRECRGRRGGDQDDEADAVCMGVAGARHFLQAKIYTDE